MLIRVTDNEASIVITDPTLVGLARTALTALGDQAVKAGTIPGDLPVSVSLTNVWRATEASLQDIRRRATTTPAETPQTM
jgi:hypothetical protein